jgi:hypothetical protein
MGAQETRLSIFFIPRISSRLSVQSSTGATLLPAMQTLDKLAKCI